MSRFTPGVQAIPRPVAVSCNGNDRACQYANSTYTSARFTANFSSVTLGCLASNPGSGTGSGSGTIRWSTGETSQVDLTIDETVLNVASVSGAVREGPFTDQRFTGKFTTSLAGGAFKCTIGAPVGGVTSADFTGSYTIE
ncbi:hypothetical protein [Actinomadura rubrisoli]|uniref:Uncharacterized protein n=1 Tax=Actinomadura rubrisoli TaxID=2530368 RepID=A0A4R4ZVT1_9ACTN|nr:hypothetical protein [Actinomadura rubrisoli]TDD63328.1 hypothetical protein E1298_43930 [Actinomadura rubrisoli]